MSESGLPRYRFIQKFGPTRAEGSVRVTAMSAPSEFRSITEVMGGTFDTSYGLRPSDQGTHLVHRNKVRWSGAMRLMHPIQKVVTRRIMNRQLRALKGILESS